MLHGSAAVSCVAAALMYVTLDKPAGLVILLPAVVIVVCRYDALLTLVRHPTSRGISKSGIAVAFGGLYLYFTTLAIAQHQVSIDVARTEAVAMAVVGIGTAVVALLASDKRKGTKA